jgi:hypothetical protein
MASKKKKVAKAVPFNPADVANIVTANPYIQRLIEDATLRDNVRVAIDSTKSAIDRLLGSKSLQKTILEDKHFQSHVENAASATRDAVLAISDAPRHPSGNKKKGLRLGRKLMIVAVGATIALVASEGLRSKVLDTLFGAEEEFQYTPPAGTPAPQSAGSPVTAA